MIPASWRIQPGSSFAPLTADQRRATDPDQSVWVSASAGSGKTQVLTARVLRLLLAGAAPSAVLCITYTRAAAAEMATRLHRMLSELALADDTSLQAALSQLLGEVLDADMLRAYRGRARTLLAQVLDSPGGLRIGTIHSFCQELLQRFPLEAGITPRQRVLDEAAAQSLQQTALAALHASAADRPELRASLALLASRADDEKLAKLLADLLQRGHAVRAALTRAPMASLLAQPWRLLGLSPEATSARLVETIRQRWQDWAPPLRQIAPLLCQSSAKDAAIGENLLAALARPAEYRDPIAALCTTLLTAEGTRRQRCPTRPFAERHPAETATLQALMAEAELLHADYIKAGIAERTAAALCVTAALAEDYAARKLALGVLDYDDLVLLVADLLERPGAGEWVRCKLDAGLDHLLLDEAQDTSADQWRIIRALTEELTSGRGAEKNQPRTLFVVGDPKQSIYSFQGARPDLFAAQQDFYAAALAQAQQPLQIVRLATSFRSAPGILRLVDDVFADPAWQAGLDRAPIRHVAHHRQLPARVGCWDIAAENATKGKAQQELATHLAQLIQRWLAAAPVLWRGGRSGPLRPGDILILFRRRAGLWPHVHRALRAAGLPVSGADRQRLAEPMAAQDLIAFMRFLLLPEDDLNLAGLLRSPFVAVADTQLEEWCWPRGQRSLWQQLGEQPAAAAIVVWLRHWLARVDFVSPHDLLLEMLATPCPGHARSARAALAAALGPAAREAIAPVLQLALQAEQDGPFSLEIFVGRLTQSLAQHKRQADTLTDQIRLMTIHSAKGLEAPVVIIPEATDLPPPPAVPLWQDDTVHGPLPWLEANAKTAAAIPLLAAVRDRALAEQDAEYRRLLYVGLTRAAEWLLVAGVPGQKKQGAASWYDRLAPIFADLPPDTDAIRWRLTGGENQESASLAPLAPPLPPLPDWLHQPPAHEPVRPVRAPSAAVAEPAGPADTATGATSLRERGRLLHRLFELLPDLPAPARPAAGLRLLRQRGLPLAEAEGMLAEVLRVLDDPRFAPLFGPGSMAEVGIAGTARGERWAGQIDRLVVRDEAVWVLDYKSNRVPPVRIPDAYRQQLAIYRDLLAAQYPDRPVRCFLLWSAVPRLEEIADT